jgi:hypothetical protein
LLYWLSVSVIADCRLAIAKYFPRNVEKCQYR